MYETRYAVVRTANGRVENVVELANGSDWSPPEGCTTFADPTGAAQVGGTWDGSTFSAAPAVASTDTLTPAERVAVDRLRASYGTTRTAAEANACIDALTLLLRRVYREIQEGGG